jgi:hypothetical protein
LSCGIACCADRLAAQIRTVRSANRAFIDQTPTIGQKLWLLQCDSQSPAEHRASFPDFSW